MVRVKGRKASKLKGTFDAKCDARPASKTHPHASGKVNCGGDAGGVRGQVRALGAEGAAELVRHAVFQGCDRRGSQNLHAVRRRRSNPPRALGAPWLHLTNQHLANK